jgi:hypothetical protein
VLVLVSRLVCRQETWAKLGCAQKPCTDGRAGRPAISVRKPISPTARSGRRRPPRSQASSDGARVQSRRVVGRPPGGGRRARSNCAEPSSCTRQVLSPSAAIASPTTVAIATMHVAVAVICSADIGCLSSRACALLHRRPPRSRQGARAGAHRRLEIRRSCRLRIRSQTWSEFGTSPRDPRTVGREPTSGSDCLSC